MSRILVIGDLMLDIYYQGSVTRISPEAPVPVLLKNTGERYVPGGAANVAMNIAAAGAEVSLLGAMGRDHNGDVLERLLLDAGVELPLVQRVDAETTTKVRFLSDTNQQLLRMDIEDAERIGQRVDRAALLDGLKDCIPQFDLIVLSDYLKGLLTREFTRAVINEAKRRGVRVLADAKDPDATKYSSAWLLKPNLAELERMTGLTGASEEAVVQAAAGLLDRCGCEYVVTTCGAGGMFLTGREITQRFPAKSRAVYDVTGAGDTVIAYLAFCLAQGCGIGEAVETANYAAGIQVGKVGTTSVGLDEVRAAMGGSCCAHPDKVLRRQDLDAFVRRTAGKTIVFTNGCFDLLHVGHKRYLEQARALGDLLVVGVNSDASVKRLKGADRPLNPVRDRVEMLTALACVDHVIVFEEDTPYELIRRIKPQVLVKGGDYRPEDVAGRDIVEENGGRTVILPFVEGRSSTALIERIKEQERRNGFS